MKALCLATEFPPARGYGLARYICEHTAALVRAGVEVDVICNNWDGGQDTYEHKAVRVFNAPYALPFEAYTWVADVLQHNALLLARGCQVIRDHGPYDALHIHDWLAAGAAKALKANYGLPLVVSIHDTALGKTLGKPDDQHQYIAQMEGWICGLADHVLANSEFTANELIEAYRVPGDKITVAGCGVDLDSFATDADVGQFKQLFCGPRERLIGFVGRLAQVKGPHILLQAAETLSPLFDNVRFVFAGDGAMRQDLERQAAERGLGDRVRFIGHIAGKVLATFYHAADLVVVPSLYEPLGLVALEAMACGRPVIASETGGLREIVQPGLTGVTVPPNDPRALASAIAQLLHNRQAAEQMGRGAREHVKTAHTWDAVAARTLEAYQAVTRAQASAAM